MTDPKDNDQAADEPETPVPPTSEDPMVGEPPPENSDTNDTNNQ